MDYKAFAVENARREFHRGQFVRMLGRLYLVDHIVDRDTLAVYVVDDFGPVGSQVWIDSTDVDTPRDSHQ